MGDSDYRRVASRAGFALSLALLIAIGLLYARNLFIWRNCPDFGFGWRTATGVDYVGQLTDNGRRAGLRLGDRFLEVNGERFAGIEQFRALMRRELGAENTYRIERAGRTQVVTVKNVPCGLRRVLTISGLPFAVGLCYALIGTLVFLMKPHRRASWIFFLFGAVFGLFLTFLRQLSTLSPAGLENVIILAYCLSPAVFVHLALSFPEERRLVHRYLQVQVVPYLISAVLFVIIRRATPVMASAPRWLTVAVVAYTALAVLFFIGSNLQLRIGSSSEIVRLRARMILLGFAIAASLPLVDFVTNSIFGVYLVPGFNYYLPFFIVFPAFVGYSIVKHDLFDIDAVIKRTYGYVLTTGALAGIYGLFVLVSNLVFGGYGFARSPAFSLLFILAVVFLFNPVKDRAQRFIDRVFYRLEYDYRATVQRISETMRSLLDLDAIGRSMMGTALGTLFVDKGYVLLLSEDMHTYDCLVEAGEADVKALASANPGTVAAASSLSEDALACGPEIAELKIPADEPLIRKITEAQKEITIYDIEEDPRFEGHRVACRQTFDRMRATLLVPLIYEKKLTGLLALGRKKSGKFYRREDINLLNILANQGAVAIENARNVAQIIEKERLRVRIMDAFGKYVTREVRDQILAGRIPLDGESREVTVLFADLRDFTTLAESTPPKAVVRIINGYFSEMAAAIGENRGLILQFIGDEIEAVFGAPAELADHPTHAVRAALAMRARLAVVNARLEREGYQPLRHGIGVHTGTVVAANIGSEDRLSYAMVGDTVNLTSRIQGLNKQFGSDILVSAITAARLSADFPLEKLPATAVKGKKAPVEVFRLLE